MCGCQKKQKIVRTKKNTTSLLATTKTIPLGMNFFVPLPIDFGEVDNWGKVVVVPVGAVYTVRGAVNLRGYNAQVSPILRGLLSEKYPEIIPPYAEVEGEPVEIEAS